MDVDVVTVAYRSGAHLRQCLEPLLGHVHAIVVDNACPERSAELVRELPLEVVEMGANAGFGAGCNAGALRGSGDAILFLNPDARITPEAIGLLVARLEDDPALGCVGPRIVNDEGGTDRSIGRLPTLPIVFGEALFLHHLLPALSEFQRGGYDVRGDAGWLHGAALLVRRRAFEAVGGFDERLFLYCEDTDLCARLARAGFGVSYEPAAVSLHAGGASIDASGRPPLRAQARVTYARLHAAGARYAAFRAGIALHELARLPLAALRSRAEGAARLRSLAVSLGARAPSGNE